MPKNKLSHLLGGYQSDSDDENKNKSTEVLTDWTQCKDASTGLPYYYNIITKEVTWEMPTEYEQFLRYALVKYPNQLVQWTLCHTEDNAKYYFNEYTREISWQKPDDFNEPEANKTAPVTTDNNLNTAKNNKFNLVPEYDSDDSEDDKAEPEKSSQVLFPSSSRINQNDHKPEEIILPPNTKSTSPTNEINADSSAKPQTFASIITGGRSPQQEQSIDINDDNSQSTVNEPQITNDNEFIPQKTFQRKRRIEFQVSKPVVKRNNFIPNTTDNVDKLDNESSNHTNKYANFQKAATEFDDKQTADNETEINPDIHNKPFVELKEEQCLLEAKLEFLCHGRADLSPVQIIQVQLQTLQAAYIAESLQPNYFLDWMKQISTDLIKLESDAAPDGWKCLWNRERAQYCYEHLSTGEIRWEYPETEKALIVTDSANDIDDDAMDISTTPPHNPQETNNSDITALPSSAWATTTTEKPIEDELASFYSDIASMAPSTNAEEPINEAITDGPDSAGESVGADGGGVDDKKRKKKKKGKKVEPWRSGNLETWINKWQQAQKELDG